MKKTACLLLAFWVLSAHELFLKSDNYFLQPDTGAEVYLINGTFDESENAITQDRIISPRIIGPGYDVTPESGHYSIRGKATYLEWETGSAGTYLAGISTKPRMIELTGQKFTDYLEHEGLTDVIASREQQGISEKTANEQYAKHVKALLQVGDNPTNHYQQKLGYPVEFIPLQNPYALKAGDEITFQLLAEGKPLPNQTVHCSYRSPTHDNKQENMMRTNAKGEVTFTLNEAGQWYVASIHMVTSNQPGIDYISEWATLTFGVR